MATLQPAGGKHDVRLLSLEHALEGSGNLSGRSGAYSFREAEWGLTLDVITAQPEGRNDGFLNKAMSLHDQGIAM